MRILICTRNFGIGGFSTFTINISRELRNRGYQALIFAIEPYGVLFSEFRQAADEVIIYSRGLQTLRKYLGNLQKRIEEIEPDIVINNAVPHIQVIFPVLSSEIKKYSVLHNVVDDEVNICLQNVDYTDKIVCVSDNCLNKIRSVNPSNVDKYHMIPVGIKATGKNKNFSNRKLQIIYVGRMDNNQKNLDAIKEILTQLKKGEFPFEMHFIGEGPDLPRLKKIIHKANLSTYCIFYGSLNPDEVHHHLEQADIFLMTSYFEGTPHTLLEAMAHGVIPIASRISGSTDRIITDRENGLLCEIDNIDQYINAITLIINDSPLRKSIQLNAKTFIEENYSIRRIADQYISLFEMASIRPERYPKIEIDRFSKKYCITWLVNIRTYLGNIKRTIFDGIKPVKS